MASPPVQKNQRCTVCRRRHSYVSPGHCATSASLLSKVCATNGMKRALGEVHSCRLCCYGARLSRAEALGWQQTHTEAHNCHQRATTDSASFCQNSLPNNNRAVALSHRRLTTRKVESPFGLVRVFLFGVGLPWLAVFFLAWLFSLQEIHPNLGKADLCTSCTHGVSTRAKT